ncbi:MAG: hypothetical protein HY691_14240 [Chloroflexi bacterium]|nr:hypothetical protein [Chloroflexota bacterium]
MRLAAERFVVDDTPEAVAELFYRKGWTDGLPIIPPTPERVARMLAGWRAAPGHVVGLVPPSFAEATLEKLAVNAVMAGCAPEHLPAVVAALEAMLEPRFNLNGIQCTTSSTTPLVLFNGPIRRALAIKCGANAFGPGARSNAVIGRALRLILLAVGGAMPGDVDKAALGQPGKFCFCFGENEEASPWEPFHVAQGLAAAESAVTVVGVTGSIEVRDSDSRSGEGVLKTVARSMTSASFVAASNIGDGGQALLVFTPEHARTIRASGFTRADAQAWLWQEARMALADFPPETAGVIAAWQRTIGLPADGVVCVTKRPEDILIVVAGGEGTKSAFIPTWGGVTQVVTRAISQTAAALCGRD